MSSTIFIGPTYTLSQRASDETFELSSPPQRACDRCRRRKQKCNGLNICQNCEKYATLCTYHAAPKRRGPKRRKITPRSHSFLDIDSSQFHHHKHTLPIDGAEVEEFAVSTPESLTELPRYGNETSHGFSHFAVDDSSYNYDTPSSTYYTDPGFCSSSDNIDDGESDSFRCSPIINGPMNQRRTLKACEVENDAINVLTRSAFWPYLQYFFENLYPIFPVLDKTKFLDEFLNDPNLILSANEYALLTALSAAISAQQNLSGFEDKITAISASYGQASNNVMPSADFLVAQCLETRQQSGYIDKADEYTILTSFFLFYYHGNFNQSQSAWYYLREAIHFALMLQLNDSKTYDGMADGDAQRLRRLYWLLYVTERAYALQTQGYTILQPSIDVPRVFESGNPRLIYGFLILINIFKSVDQHNLTYGHNDKLDTASMCKDDVSTGVFNSQELDETQRMDIEVTRHWLRVLAWRMRPNDNPGRGHLSPLHALNVSKDLLGVIATARRQSLEVHGIGMEQKLFDVACVLSNVIQHTPSISPNNFSAAHNMLHSFMSLLVSFRNRESRYLQPLLQQATKSLERGMAVPLPLAFNVEVDVDGVPDDLYSTGCS